MPRAARAIPTRIITGLADIDRRLAELPLAPANRVARKGLSVAVRLLARRMRAKVDAGLKNVKKALTGYVKKNKDTKLIQAKAGGVGKQGTRDKQREAKAKHAASGKRGVGIGSRNIHWYIMGTTDRTQKTTGRRTGQMPAHPIVKEAAAAGLTEALAEAEAKCREALAIEIAKLGGTR